MDDRSFIGALMLDVQKAIARHRGTGSQSDRRDLIRTAFAAFEGMVWVLRENVIDAADSTSGLEVDEKLVLAEATHFLTDDGRIRAQSRFIPLLAMVRLLARIAGRIAPTKAVDFSGGDWNRVRLAVAIRHRVTHPKSREDLNLSEQDVATCLEALFWFLRQTAEILEAINAATIDYLGQLNHVFNDLKNGNEEMQALYNRIRDAGMRD